MAASPDNLSRRPPTKVAPPEDSVGPEVYVMRLPEPSRRFAWEIRRLSTIVLERSRGDFATAESARMDGQAVLEVLLTLRKR